MLNKSEKQLVEKISQLNDIKWYMNLYEPKGEYLDTLVDLLHKLEKEVSNMLVKTTTLNNQLGLEL